MTANTQARPSQIRDVDRSDGRIGTAMDTWGWSEGGRTRGGRRHMVTDGMRVVCASIVGCLPRNDNPEFETPAANHVFTSGEPNPGGMPRTIWQFTCRAARARTAAINNRFATQYAALGLRRAAASVPGMKQ